MGNSFASRRQGVGFACMMIGGLLAFLCISLPLLLSLSTWPPWGDVILDSDGVVAHGSTTGRHRAVSGNNTTHDRSVTSWMLDVQLADGAHAGKTTEVYCTVEHGCPLVRGSPVVVEVAPQDVSLARLKGHRFSVLPFALFVVISALGVLSSVASVVGVGLYVTGARPDRS